MSIATVAAAATATAALAANAKVRQTLNNRTQIACHTKHKYTCIVHIRLFGMLKLQKSLNLSSKKTISTHDPAKSLAFNKKPILEA